MILTELHHLLHNFTDLPDRREQIERAVTIFRTVDERFDELIAALDQRSPDKKLILLETISHRATVMYHQGSLRDETALRSVCRRVLDRISADAPGVCAPIEGEM